MQHRVATFATLRDAARSRCDACDEKISGDAEQLVGKGTYVWSRGGEIRREEVPLCPRCSTALGMTLLSRLAIEEEEG